MAEVAKTRRARQSRALQVTCARTKLCAFLQAGSCPKGGKCTFAHHAWQLRAAPDYSKTKMCKALVTSGACTNPSCAFAHSEQELKALPSRKAKQRRSSLVRDQGAELQLTTGAPTTRSSEKLTYPAHEEERGDDDLASSRISTAGASESASPRSGCDVTATSSDGSNIGRSRSCASAHSDEQELKAPPSLKPTQDRRKVLVKDRGAQRQVDTGSPTTRSSKKMACPAHEEERGDYELASSRTSTAGASESASPRSGCDTTATSSDGSNTGRILGPMHIDTGLCSDVLRRFAGEPLETSRVDHEALQFPTRWVILSL